MALALDTKSLFDQDEFSDVKIKICDITFQCHKIILCRNSEHFRALCGPGAGFKEAGQSEIELRDDEYPGAEAVLRFLYGFDYNELQESFGVGKLKKIKSAETHMNTFFAAQKYRIPQLGEKAFQHLRRDVGALRHVGNATLPTIDIFDFVTCLIAHSVHHSDFSTLANDLINARLPSLCKLAEFRSLLETEPWRETLKLSERAIRCGHAFVSSKGNGNVEWLLECEDCGEGWITEEKELSCSSCGGRTLKAKKM